MEYLHHAADRCDLQHIPRRPQQAIQALWPPHLALHHRGDSLPSLTPLVIFPNLPEAIPTLAEWQPQPEAPNPWAANAGN
jgi:hypothetical protein